MSEIVTSEIVKEIGTSWYTLKVDRTKDPTGCENVSIVVRYLDNNKRPLVRASTKHCDALSLTNLVLSELTKVGLTPVVYTPCHLIMHYKPFFDVYDMLYGFLKKPAVAAVYMRRLLDQRRTDYGHHVSHREQL